MSLLLLLLACAEDRALVELPACALPSAAAFTPAEGVAVALDEATLTLESLTLHTPGLASAPRLLREARAHPGHEGAGDQAGELQGPWTLDLLAGPTALGLARAYEGELAEATITLGAEPPLRLSGLAEVDGAARPFAWTLPLDEDVRGVPLGLALTAEAPPEGLGLSIDLAMALSFVDWRAEALDDEPTLARVAFGLLSTPTWNLTTESPCP